MPSPRRSRAATSLSMALIGVGHLVGMAVGIAMLVAAANGGAGALQAFLAPIARRIDAPILIVEHMPKGYTRSDERLLEDICEQLGHSGIDVSEVPGKPGVYRAVAFLKPHFQLDELSMSMRLVADLPGERRRREEGVLVPLRQHARAVHAAEQREGVAVAEGVVGARHVRLQVRLLEARAPEATTAAVRRIGARHERAAEP